MELVNIDGFNRRREPIYEIIFLCRNCTRKHKDKLLCRGQANRAITNPETETKDKGRDTKMKKKKKTLEKIPNKISVKPNKCS